MNMHKIIFSFLGITCLIALTLCSSGQCSTPVANFPKISLDRVAIGGIQPFATKDYVRSIYGEPDEISERNSKSYDYSEPDETWKYGETFSISFANGKVFCLDSSGPNGLKTPDGIAVGDSEGKLLAAYGKGWRNGYWYKSEYDINLYFQVKNGKVVSISAGWNL